MTTIKTVDDFIDELRELLDTKEHPEEWYILSGKQVGEYSIHTAEQPEEVPPQDELPPEAQDATENVEGFYQIGTLGWGADAFEDDVAFVEETGFSETFDVIDRRINGLLLVHESALSEKALALVQSDDEDRERRAEA